MSVPLPRFARLIALIQVGLLLLAAAASGQRLTKAAHEDYEETLGRWVTAWRTGRIDWRDVAARSGKVHGLYEGLIIPDSTELDHFGALRLLLGILPEHDDKETLTVVLRLAGFGLGDLSDTTRGGTALVREAALEALSRVDDGRALDLLWRVAEGSVKGAGPPERRAALLALGRRGSGTARVALERTLSDKDPRTRLAASLGLTRHAHPNSLRAIARRLLEEDDPLVARSLIDAVRTIAQTHRDPNGGHALPKGHAETALFVAQERLGSLGLEVDQAIIELCATLRAVRSVPFLIDFLGTATEDRKLTPLRARAGDVLRELTGALYPADEPESWRTFWERERDGFRLAPIPKREAGRTQTGFFGIEVRGARVAFVIDLSGSMAAAHAPIPGLRTSTEQGAMATRLEWAVYELRRTVTSMSPDTRFEILTFANRSRRLFGKLIEADGKGRKRVHSATEDLVAQGGTNLWDALDGALDLGHPVWGKARPRRFDEIFVLSDGEPSVGDLTEPDLILAAVRESNRFQNVRIHAISLNPAGSPLMERLAKENDGRYVSVGR